MDAELRSRLAGYGLPAGDLHGLPDSEKRFPDGGAFRIEIPSTEGQEGVEEVADAAGRLGVPLHRVSQGSGVMMLSDQELDGMALAARRAGLELSLFARPNAGWSASAMTRADAGGVLAPAARGMDQLVHDLDDILRAAGAGVRSVLIADVGLLDVFRRLREDGVVPRDMRAKVSVMMPAANPASARLFQQLGADSLNLPTDLDLAQIAAIRAAVDVPLDIYVEAPGNLGGFVRIKEIPELIRIAAPVYLKFGLGNGPDIYPTGAHLRDTALAMSRERVHRALLGYELVVRSGLEGLMSPVGAADLAVPVEPQDPRESARPSAALTTDK